MDSVAGEPVAADAGIEIAFEADGSVAGSTGVNRLMGHYAQDGERLTAGPLATTKMAGPAAAMSLEQRLLAALAHPLTMRFDDEVLVLLDGDDERLSLTKQASSAPSAEPPAEPSAELTVRGEVLYRERVAFPAGARVTVRLEDVARADAPSTELATQQIDDAAGVPVPFELTVARERIEEHAVLAVSARIESGDDLLWVSDTRNEVPVDADSEGVTIIVVSVTS